jgi:hypothetical protein
MQNMHYIVESIPSQTPIGCVLIARYRLCVGLVSGRLVRKTMQMCPLQRRGRSMLTYDLRLIHAGLRHTATPSFGMARKSMSMSKLCVRVCRRDLRPGTSANSN